MRQLQSIAWDWEKNCINSLHHGGTPRSGIGQVWIKQSTTQTCSFPTILSSFILFHSLRTCHNFTCETRCIKFSMGINFSQNYNNIIIIPAKQRNLLCWVCLFTATFGIGRWGYSSILLLHSFELKLTSISRLHQTFNFKQKIDIFPRTLYLSNHRKVPLTVFLTSFNSNESNSNSFRLRKAKNKMSSIYRIIAM